MNTGVPEVSSVETDEIPSLYSHVHFRSFLEAVFLAKKRLNPRYSARRFAEVVGFASPNYLQMIIEGKRGLSLEMGQQIAEKLKFTTNQKNYFLALIKLDLAKSLAEKHEAEKARLVAVKKILSKEIPAAQNRVLSKWYHLLVRELFLLKKPQSSPSWISKMLAQTIGPAQAEESIEVLCDSGFLKPAGNGYRVTEPVVQTNEDTLLGVFMRQHHSELLKTWSQNLERLSPSEQELGVLNIPINSKKIPELRRRIRQFQDEIVGFVQGETDANCVVQLGTYLMPFPKEEDI